MKLIKTGLAALAIGATGFALGAPATAESQTKISVTQQADFATSGDFIRKSKRLKGAWNVVERDGRTFIVFSDDFRAANGGKAAVRCEGADIAHHHFVCGLGGAE